MSDAPEKKIRDSTATGGEELSKTEIFDILSADRRQEVLQYLHRNDGGADIGELAEHIASLECGCAVSQLDSQQRKRTYVGLYQCHLPKMDDMHIVDFNQNRGLIELGPNADQIYPYIEEDEGTDVKWPLVYLGLSALGAVLLVASLTVGASIGLTPGIVSAACIAAVGGASVLHARS